MLPASHSPSLALFHDLETTFKSGLEAPGGQSLRKQNCFLETLKAHLQLSGVPTPSPCTHTFSHGLSRTPTRLHTSHTRTPGTPGAGCCHADDTLSSGVHSAPSHRLFPTHSSPPSRTSTRLHPHKNRPSSACLLSRSHAHTSFSDPPIPTEHLIQDHTASPSWVCFLI